MSIRKPIMGYIFENTYSRVCAYISRKQINPIIKITKQETIEEYLSRGGTIKYITPEIGGKINDPNYQEDSWLSEQARKRIQDGRHALGIELKKKNEDIQRYLKENDI